MSTNGNDVRTVYVASAAAAHGLMQFFVTNMGPTDVLGDEHYHEMSLQTGLTIAENRVLTIETDRRTFIQGRLENPNYKGVIPATPDALKDVQDMGLQKIVDGFICQGIAPVPDGTKLDVYR